MLKKILFAAVTAGVLQTAHAQKAPVEVQFSETYELANVILALTPYGIADEFEVQKNTAYYREVMAWFAPMKDHPLLQQANYSREKWDYYLAFRTDAFAFAFDEQGKIRRQFRFYTQRGLKPFDNLLPLVQDFAEKSNFRQFYKQHQPERDAIVRRYEAYYMVPQMQAFLQREFGTFASNDRNLIVLSTLVNRMNCRRILDRNTSADFATLSLFLIESDGRTLTEGEQAMDVHTLLTEMDHGYVNPVSDQHKKLIAQNFHTRQWDRGSGYGGINCFNEYMTWAVYDLFTREYFPAVADSVNRNWHFQNNTRGFIASSLFGKKLCELYAARKPGQRIRDLYPALLAWAGSVQGGLREPRLAQDTIFLTPESAGQPLRVAFTEPMQPCEFLDFPLFQVIDGERQALQQVMLYRGKGLSFEGNTLVMALDGLPRTPGLYGFSLNFWGRRAELTSVNGASLATPTRVYIRIKG